MKVEFENSNGERREIGTSDTTQGCFQIISDFLTEHNFKSYYTRVSEYDLKLCSENECELWIDVGSHTEFFYITQ